MQLLPFVLAGRAGAARLHPGMCTKACKHSLHLSKHCRNSCSLCFPPNTWPITAPNLWFIWGFVARVNRSISSQARDPSSCAVGCSPASVQSWQGELVLGCLLGLHTAHRAAQPLAPEAFWCCSFVMSSVTDRALS